VGLELLCVGTSLGRLEFYPFSSSTSEPEDQTETATNAEKSFVSASTGSVSSCESPNKPPMSLSDPSLLVNKPYTFSSLRELIKLTAFVNIKPSFSANVPSSWQK